MRYEYFDDEHSDYVITRADTTLPYSIILTLKISLGSFLFKTLFCCPAIQGYYL
jgi:hypothetical protein